MPTDIERINAALAKGWRLCPGEPERLSARYKLAIETAIPEVVTGAEEYYCDRIEKNGAEMDCLNMIPVAKVYCFRCRCVRALTTIADILEGKDANEIARLRADNAALARDLELDEFPENDPRLHACSCRWAKDAEGIPTGDPIQVCAYHARHSAALAKAPCQRNDYNRWCPDRLDGFPRSDWCEPCKARAYKEKPCPPT